MRHTGNGVMKVKYQVREFNTIRRNNLYMWGFTCIGTIFTFLEYEYHKKFVWREPLYVYRIAPNVSMIKSYAFDKLYMI